MRFTVNRKAFLDALAKVQTVAPKKFPLPILTHALVEADPGEVWLTTTDLDNWVSVRIPAEAEGYAALAIPLKDMKQFLRQQKGEVVTFDSEEDKLAIMAENAKALFNTMPAAEFPERLQPESSALEINSRVLYRLLDMAGYAVSDEEFRPILNGLYVHTGKGKIITAVGTNGHRMAIVSDRWNQSPKKELEMILNRGGVKALLKLLKHLDTNIKMWITERGEHQTLDFELPDGKVSIRLIEGPYPGYMKVVPLNNPNVALLDKAEYIGALKQLKHVAERQECGRVAMEFSNGTLRMRTYDPELGLAETSIPCRYKGDRIRIGFNIRYWWEILTRLSGNTVRITMSEPERAAVITSPDDKDYLCLLMPLRLLDPMNVDEWEDKKEEQAEPAAD